MVLQKPATNFLKGFVLKRAFVRTLCFVWQQDADNVLKEKARVIKSYFLVFD